MKDYSFYLEGTTAKGVLLVHGLTGAPAEMKFVAKQLHKQGFSVYAPLLVGHGVDEKTLNATRYEDWLEGLRAALTRFGPEIREIHAAGICVGGALALYLARSEQRLKSVVIYSAALHYDGWSMPFYYPVLSRLTFLSQLPVLRTIAFAEQPPYGIKSERLRKLIMNGGVGIEGTLPRFPAPALHQNHRLNKALKKALPTMNIPTLFIHAKEDDVSHPRNAYAIQKLHGGPCSVQILEDSYHMIHVDQERHKVAEMTAEFFEASSKNAG